ncbi:hypothetical protein QMA56_05025 [Leuconostoc falkenbergense]|uniref:hypothetical protein n=1 Tax=Leuconostoc falkenbergense TaxID=2766470 RepID=UPI0024AE4405|nr:hypothetical protein [Leuconostoc falkenbergense]MDI6667071.1 hypothetical protein [Leuconostoc falkenbergense]
MDFDKVKSILNTLDNRRQELGKLLELENKTKDRTSYWVGIESLQLEFSKSEVAQILDEKKKSLESEIRGLAKELSVVNND